MKTLQEILFEHTLKALHTYSDAATREAASGGGPEFAGLRIITEVRRQRLATIFEVIEEAGLVEEYQEWRKQHDQG